MEGAERKVWKGGEMEKETEGKRKINRRYRRRQTERKSGKDRNKRVEKELTGLVWRPASVLWERTEKGRRRQRERGRMEGKVWEGAFKEV